MREDTPYKERALSTIEIGIACHSVWRERFVGITRDELDPKDPEKRDFADPGKIESLTEKMDPIDEDNYIKTAVRGWNEEFGMVPKDLRFCGITRKGHGFFTAYLTDAERYAMRLCKEEGHSFSFYRLESLIKLRPLLGGAIGNHLDAYPEAFAKIARGETVLPDELGLRLLEVEVPIVR